MKELRKPVEPVIDDEFAKGLGLEGLDALKDRLRSEIERLSHCRILTEDRDGGSSRAGGSCRCSGGERGEEIGVGEGKLERAIGSGQKSGRRWLARRNSCHQSSLWPGVAEHCSHPEASPNRQGGIQQAGIDAAAADCLQCLIGGADSGGLPALATEPLGGGRRHAAVVINDKDPPATGRRSAGCRRAGDARGRGGHEALLEFPRRSIPGHKSL